MWTVTKIDFDQDTFDMLYPQNVEAFDGSNGSCNLEIFRDDEQIRYKGIRDCFARENLIEFRRNDQVALWLSYDSNATFNGMLINSINGSKKHVFEDEGYYAFEDYVANTMKADTFAVWGYPESSTVRYMGTMLRKAGTIYQDDGLLKAPNAWWQKAKKTTAVNK